MSLLAGNDSAQLTGFPSLAMRETSHRSPVAWQPYSPVLRARPGGWWKLWDKPLATLHGFRKAQESRHWTESLPAFSDDQHVLDRLCRRKPPQLEGLEVSPRSAIIQKQRKVEAPLISTTVPSVDLWLCQGGG